MGIYSMIASSGGGGGGSTSNRSYQLISTTDISSAATIEFTDLSEDLYLLVLKDLEYGDSFSSNRGIDIRTSDDNGTTWDQGDTDYSHAKSGRYTTASQGGGSNGDTKIVTSISSADTDEPAKRTYCEIFIMNINNASRNTNIFGSGWGADGDMMDFVGVRLTAQADDAVQLDTTGSFVDGTAYLYKIVEGV